MKEIIEMLNQASPGRIIAYSVVFLIAVRFVGWTIESVIESICRIFRRK